MDTLTFFIILYLLTGLTISTYNLLKQPVYYRSFFYFGLIMYIWPLGLLATAVKFFRPSIFK